MNCREIDDAAYIYFGNGISCAFLLGGRVYTGANDFAGELGMLSFSHGVKYEAELSKDVLKKLDSGEFGEEFERETKGITEFLINVCKIFDFRDVIIGGPYAKFSSAMAETLNKKLAAEKFLKTTASVAVSGSVDEGLFLSALGFAHETVIKSV